MSRYLLFQEILLLRSILTLININPTPANIILKYDFERGSYEGIARQFQEQTCRQDKSYIDRSLFQIVTDKTRAGKYALKHHIKNCDERSEVAIPGGFLKKGQEYWIGWSYYFPTNFIKPTGRDHYTIIQQMGYKKAWLDQNQGKTLFRCNQGIKPGGVYRTIGAPGSEMAISPQGNSYQYTIKFYQGKDNQGRNIFDCQSFQIPASLERWEDFVMNVKFSDDPKVGFIKLWKNGVLYINKKVALLPPDVDTMDDWKMGVYVGESGNGERIVYTDELKVGNENSSLHEVSSQDR